MSYISDLTKGSICAGNIQVHVVSNIELHMYAAMAMAFSGDKKAAAWAVKNGALHLYSAPEHTAFSLPFPMSYDLSAKFALEWLGSLKEDQLGKQPDIDGSTTKGWCIDNKHVHVDDWKLLAKIKPTWLLYHKLSNNSDNAKCAVIHLKVCTGIVAFDSNVMNRWNICR